MLFHLERHSPGHNAVDELAAGLMDLSAVRDLFLSPAVATTTAAAISSFVIGYYAGVGRSLFAYNADSRRRLVADTDDDEEEDDDDALLDDNMGRSRVAAAFMEECKMVFVVRTDLKMDKGKIAAQCGHATLSAYKAALRHTPQHVQTWERLGQAKVALKCTTEQEMIEIEEKAKRAGIVAKPIFDA
ncbi:hypothetical protein OC846_005581 [Tilletia horrida]|uniref:peptidyl-tRNA hydrolase n=1 Tax=Tilletia horrida TaxID=155126 RepID=A0AAN6GL05_9BASI|nr:hypothetical protein OC846_005581 [Tilletia horrida]